MKKRVFYLVSGGGFQWESLTLVEQLKDAWTVTYIVPESSVYEGSALLEAIGDSDYLAVPEVSSRAENGVWQSLSRIWKTIGMVYPLIRDGQPDAVVTLGSSLSFPIAIAARRAGAKTIFIESMTRTDSLSATGKLLSLFRLVDKFYVQWPEQESLGRKAEYRGTVL